MKRVIKYFLKYGINGCAMISKEGNKQFEMSSSIAVKLFIDAGVCFNVKDWKIFLLFF